VRAALVAALIALPGCALYFEEEGDDQPPPPPWPDAGWWDVDAGTSPDADPGDCNAPLTCPAASPNRVSVCGRVLDVATENAVLPSQVAITAYDALEYAGDPNNAQPLDYESLSYDECARFRLVNVERPALGFIALSTDDPADSGMDTYAMAAVAFPVGSAETRTRERLYAINRTTDSLWTSQAGLTGGSFVTRGAVLAVFLGEDGQPVSGVTVTEGGATEPANDYYFANANPWARTTVDSAMDATGANGSVLKLESPLVEHSGQGGCEGAWDSALAASIPGVLFVAIRHCYLGP
jgi:hypothetical protein